MEHGDVLPLDHFGDNSDVQSCGFYSIGVKRHEITVQFHADWLHKQKEIVEAFARVFELSGDWEEFCVVLDFANVDNLSSMAIGEIFRFEKVIKGRGTLSIANCKPWVMTTLRVVHLHEKCDIQAADESLMT